MDSRSNWLPMATAGVYCGTSVAGRVIEFPLVRQIFILFYFLNQKGCLSNLPAPLELIGTIAAASLYDFVHIPFVSDTT